MMDKARNSKPAVIARVTSYGRHSAGGRSVAGAGRRDFAPGAMVRSRALVRNDGTYPRRDIGEVLVVENDIGRVCESWSFLGERYYTVEFTGRGVVVILRAQEIAGAARKAAGRPETGGVGDDRSILLVG